MDTFPTSLLLIPEKARFWLGKPYVGQVPNSIEFIEERFERKLIRGVALANITAAYDAINHGKLLCKLYGTLKGLEIAQGGPIAAIE